MKNTIVRRIFKQVSKTYLISLFVCILFVLGLILVPVKQVHAANNTYYVAKGGSDSNSGTEASPWLTIQKAANTMVAGDTVYVKDGVYSEYVYIGTYHGYTGKSGTLGSPVTYKAYPGHHPIIDVSSLAQLDWRPSVAIYNVSYITFEGFEIRNNPYTDGMILLSGTNSIILRNLKIHNILYSGIKSWGTNGLTIDACEVYDTNKASGDEQISMMPAYNFEIMNCKLHDSYNSGIDCKVGSSNGKIHHNEIYGTGYVAGNHSSGTTSIGIYLDCSGTAMDNIQIYDNVIHDCNSAGIALASEVAPYPSLTNVDIYNNLIYNNHQGFVVWSNPSFTRNFRVINNTFYNNYGTINIYGLASDGNLGINLNCIIRNNIIAGSTPSDNLIYYTPAAGTIAIDHNLFYKPSGVYDNAWLITIAGNYMAGNPVFVGPPSDFHLQANSPARDSGSADNAPTTDYAGTTRPQGTGYDIGAYEYIAALTPPMVTTSAASGLTTTRATLNANLTSKGTASTVTVSFEYGLTTAYGSTNAGVPPTFTTTGAFIASLTSLTPNTLYHYRAKAVGDGTAYGLDQTFTTGYAAWDVNRDGTVNVLDMISISQHWGESGTPGWIPQDVNGDGVINALDMIIIGQHWTG